MIHRLAFLLEITLVAQSIRPSLGMLIKLGQLYLPNANSYLLGGSISSSGVEACRRNSSVAEQVEDTVKHPQRSIGHQARRFQARLRQNPFVMKIDGAQITSPLPLPSYRPNLGTLTELGQLTDTVFYRRELGRAFERRRRYGRHGRS